MDRRLEQLLSTFLQVKNRLMFMQILLLGTFSISLFFTPLATVPLLSDRLILFGLNFNQGSQHHEARRRGRSWDISQCHICQAHARSGSWHLLPNILPENQFLFITCVRTYYLIEVLYYRNSLGRQEAGETDCHDVSVWCYL